MPSNQLPTALPETAKETAARSGTIEELLRRYLCLYWLRPETASWRTADALAIRQLGVAFTPPVLDLACGDGLNSYVLLGGGEPPLTLDAFVDTVPAVGRNDFLSGRVDLYDHTSTVEVEAPVPPLQVDVGLDHKAGLLRKASRLHLYRQTVLQDANQRLPFLPNTFSSIFSNALYWIQNLAGVLAEANRILRPGGQLIALVPNERYRADGIYRLYEAHGWDWCRVLDRGRHAVFQHHYPEGTWRAHVEAAGLTVTAMQPCVSSRLYQMTEIGLRLLSPVLIRMANTLKAEDRLSMKRDWIEYCLEVLHPMFTSGWLTDPSIPQIYHLVVASKLR